MAKMSRAQARRRLKEAYSKFLRVYIGFDSGWQGQHQVVKTSDMEAMEKIVTRCIKRIP